MFWNQRSMGLGLNAYCQSCLYITVMFLPEMLTVMWTLAEGLHTAKLNPTRFRTHDLWIMTDATDVLEHTTVSGVSKASHV